MTPDPLTYEELDRLADELWHNDETELESELEAWGVDPDAYTKLQDGLVEQVVNSIAAAGDPTEVHSELRGLYLNGFALGVKVAMEAEMRRRVEEVT